MTEPQNSRKIEPEIIDIEKKDGLLEELNLPPRMIKFIRANTLNIQIVAGVLVVLILGWSYYDYYSQTKQGEAALALSTAVKQKDNTVRLESLTTVAKEYSGTGAASWSLLEEGNLAFQEGRYDEALSRYQEVNAGLPGGSPLQPLVTYAMALAQENAGQLEQAQASFQKLAMHKGFKSMALAAQGRIYELQGEPAKALKVYRQIAEDQALSSQNRSLIEEKINNLQAVVPEVTG
jgi:predicted negative regulator of RcsB-dependent stress response